MMNGLVVWVTHSKINSLSKFNPIPNDKFSDQSKLKEHADDITNVTEKLKSVLGRAENIVGKAENAGYQPFLLFLQCFLKGFFSPGR